MIMQKPSCAVKRYVIQASDLPLCCPLKDERLWDAHPRVYLPIQAGETVCCPYCGTEYVF